MREMDLIFGQFADSHIAQLSEDELDLFERLLDLPDRDLFAWLTGEKATPREYQTDLLEKVTSFHVNKSKL